MRAVSTTLLACVLLALFGAGALASSAPACSRGCDVPVGTYTGTNDQGKAVVLHVAVGHLKSGPHIVATVHIINHFKTHYVVHCGDHRANNYVDTTHWGHIDGVIGHLRYGENRMDVFWTPGEPIQGVAHLKSRACSGSTSFTLHRTHH